MKVSISQVKCYKACRRLYYLQYVEGLRYNKPIESLETGSNYHEMLESLYQKGDFEIDIDNPKVSAMACAYKKYVYPKFNVNAVEEWFDIPLTKKHSLIGRFDGKADDGFIVEHKTTSGDIGEEYEFNLQWDEQVLAYMLASGSRSVYYTVCKKPTIRLKQNETNEDFFKRCCDWYDEDTESKIRMFIVTRTDEEVLEFRKQLVKTVQEMEKCHLYYNNPNYCNSWGRRCEFSSICLNYDAKLEYVDFTKTDKRERRN